jgi:hypothetical protein
VADALVFHSASTLLYLSAPIEILSKRPFRDDFGEMTIEAVNALLDRLSAVSKEYAPVSVYLTDVRLQERPTAYSDSILPRNESNRTKMACPHDPQTYRMLLFPIAR